jgi:HAE1 family hydrophobic/amphiphilic exporter-1
MGSSMMMGGGGSNLEIKVFGYNFDQTNKIAEDITQFLKTQNGFKDITISRDKDKAEIQIIPDRTKLSQLGLNTSILASSVRNRVLGYTVSKYKEDGTEYDIIVKYDENDLTTVRDLENMSIIGPRGNIVKLKDVAQIKQMYTTPNVEHENKIRVNKIVTTLQGRDLGSAVDMINKHIKEMDIPKNIFVEVGGAAKDMQDSFKDIAMLFVLIILLVYIVMASQFESLREPFIIMFSVPFAITGVFLSLFITGTTLNLISAIAIVMLVGIVVKNSIVLIDFTNILF